MKRNRGGGKEKAAADIWHMVVLQTGGSWRGAKSPPLWNIACYEMFHRAFPKYNKTVVSGLK
jgi:hypothetical protein